MATVITKEFILEGLCCPVCAKKIEHGAHALQGVNSANLDFMAQRLTLELAEQSDAQQIVREITELVRHAEPDVRIHERRAAEQMAQAQRASRVRYLRLGGGFILFAAGLLLSVPAWSERLLFLLSYLIVGGDILWRALKNITRGHIFDENFLMSIATIGAFALGEYPEGVAVMLFYQVGEAFQDHAVGRSRASISALMDIRPDFANLKIAGETRRVAPEEVSVGDFILVQPGEKIPLDGTVSAGYAALDTSALTGESLPRDVEPGSAVLSGSINQNGLLTIQVTKIFAESTVSKILHLVQNASAQKAPLENFISKFARYYTPAVVFAAFALAVIPPLVIPGAHFADWLNRALVFLVVSCPCALVISIPLSFFGGIGGASRSGILVKGSHYLEGLHDVDTIIFDKTGTLTQGIFQVRDIVAANEFSREALLDYAVHAESHSTHPIALSIRSAYQ
ncbi:MAG: heavy metal translocating P-type ATPase, partial [Peptococcaceae bacterium]|nr:heavy metal translocating P-type ATPase [Peptococcaceae bacterium]